MKTAKYRRNSGKTTITRRIKPCNCGCEGTDPWHAKTYERVITDIRDERGRTQVDAYRFPVEYRRVGKARLPWGEGRMKRVVEVVTVTDDNREFPLGWFTVPD